MNHHETWGVADDGRTTWKRTVLDSVVEIVLVTLFLAVIVVDYGLSMCGFYDEN